MEDKKIRLLTGLLIIALIVIVILSGYIYILLKQNDSHIETNHTLENNNNATLIQDSNDNHSNTNENDITDTTKDTVDTITLSQLPGEFFEIEAITKEERQKENVKNYKDFEFDLDADGKIDKVTLRHIVNENEEIYSSERDYYILEYNGEIIYRYGRSFGSAGIVDLDNTDNFLEIWVYDDGPSDDPCYIFFRKVGNKIIEMGNFGVERSFLVDGKGKVVSAGRNMPWIEPSVYDCYYTIENNTFKKNKLDFSYNKDFEYTSKECFFTTNLENVNKFQNEKSDVNGDIDSHIATGKKYNINKLDANTKFKIIEFVEKANEYDSTDLKVVLNDGTVGYLIHPYGRFYIYD